MHFIRQRMKSCDEWDKGLVGHNCECLSNSLILSLYKTMQIWLSKQICTKTNMLGRKDAALSSDCFILVLQRHMIQPLLKTQINVQSFPPSKNGKIQDKVHFVETSIPWVMLNEIRITKFDSIWNFRIINILRTVLFETCNSCLSSKTVVYFTKGLRVCLNRVIHNIKRNNWSKRKAWLC